MHVCYSTQIHCPLFNLEDTIFSSGDYTVPRYMHMQCVVPELYLLILKVQYTHYYSEGPHLRLLTV